MSASAILIDVDKIISTAALNERQLFVVEKYWKEGYTQEELARKIGVSQQMVEKYCKRIKAKIEGVLETWEEI